MQQEEKCTASARTLSLAPDLIPKHVGCNPTLHQLLHRNRQEQAAFDEAALNQALREQDLNAVQAIAAGIVGGAPNGAERLAALLEDTEPARHKLIVKQIMAIQQLETDLAVAHSATAR